MRVQIYEILPTHLRFEYAVEDDEDLIITNKAAFEGSVERRQNFDVNKAYLVLHPTHTFTINYKG